MIFEKGILIRITWYTSKDQSKSIYIIKMIYIPLKTNILASGNNVITKVYIKSKSS